MSRPPPPPVATGGKGYRLYIHKPTPIFRARINLGAGDTFDVLPVDGITLGTIATPQPGHTLTLGTSQDADDLGRTRIRAVGETTQLRIARSSRGTRDGELEAVDDAFVTVWDERRVWAKIPAILPDFTTGGVVIYKDALEAVGEHMNTPPPVANAGTGFAGTIDDTSSLLTVAFDGGDSFPVAHGATITDYLWDVGDGTITVGTATTVGITATFPAGFRYVSLTVTDSNDNEHTTFVPVFARDLAADLTVPHELISRRLTPHGQELSVRVTQPLPADEYPDGALVLLWEDEPGSEGDRSHMRFVGWHHHDPSEVEAMRTATLGEVTLECLDVCGKLNTLPGFGQEVRHVPAGEATRWFEMADANMDKYIHYLLYWHSTALEVAPFVWSGTGDTYKLKIVGSEPASIFEQVQRMAQAMVPAHDFTCDSRGRLRVVVDPMLQDIGDRTSIVQRAVAASDWSMLRRQHLRPPTVRTLRSGAILASHDQELPVFALAPGFGPGQGASEQDRESQAGLTPSQSVLNSATGHLYARLNAQTGRISVTLTDPGEPGIEPADKSWVNLVIPEDAAGPRGRFGTTRCLPHEVRINYTHTRTGTVVNAEIDLEPETSGVPAQPVFLDVTGNPPPAEDEWWGGEPGDGGYWEDNFPVEPPGLFYGDPQAYILWDGARVFRTWDIMASSPTWEFADSGVTGNIQDGRYVIDGNTVGMWLMTDTAIWWCADIMADAPVWDDVLTIATVRAADATPADGETVFFCMAPYDLQPGFLCVATGPNSSIGGNSNYHHCYFWVTSNFGASWTQVDAAGTPDDDNQFTFGFGTADERSFCYSSLYAMEIFRSAPVIYCIRSIPRIGLGRVQRVIYSDDAGVTWRVRGWPLVDGANNNQDYSILHPFPSRGDYAWARSGPVGAANRPHLQRSTDEFEDDGTLNLTEQVTFNGTPAGYGGTSVLWRMNKRTLDPDHIMAWFRHTNSGNMHLLESFDAGDTWTLVYDSELTQSNIPNTPYGTEGSCARYNTPNGWPPLPETWFLVRANVTSGSTTGVIQVTQDNFQTLESRVGNLNSLLGGNNWTNGPANAFALPKIGRNS